MLRDFLFLALLFLASDYKQPFSFPAVEEMLINGSDIVRKTTLMPSTPSQNSA